MEPTPARAKTGTCEIRGLGFPAVIEADFRTSFISDSLGMVRFSLAIALILYSLFAMLDWLAAPRHWHQIWIIRFAIVDPFIILCLFATTTKKYAQTYEIWNVAAILVLGLGIAAMLWIVDVGEPGYWLYYAGIVLVALWGGTMMRLRFRIALVTLGSLTAAYEALVLFGQHLPSSGAGRLFFVNNNFFFLSSVVLALAAGYFIESGARREFFQRREIAERNAELRSFSHTVAHDLKAPLANIVAIAGILRQNSGPVRAEDEVELLQTMMDIGIKASRIVDEMLKLCELRHGGSLKLESLDMGRIVDEAVRRTRLQHESIGVSLARPEALPTAVGNAQLVEEIWVNYLSNAMKYGGTPPEIAIGADDCEGAIRFWVEDNGKGIESEAAARLFAEFSRLEDANLREGHGLGLSIVRRIAERLGGRVGVESELGKGSRFWFTLPKAGAQPPEDLPRANEARRAISKTKD